MNLLKKYHVKKALHTCFFAVKGKLLFIWQEFLYNPSEKAKPIGRTGDKQI